MMYNDIRSCRLVQQVMRNKGDARYAGNDQWEGSTIKIMVCDAKISGSLQQLKGNFLYDSANHQISYF